MTKRISTHLRGFTLVELMVSIAMFAIIAIALQSAVLLASKAIPDSKSSNVCQLASAAAADRMVSETGYALTVSEMTATSITFTVADRDGDGAAETIRYAWSGVAGDPLTRSYNGGTATSVLDDVREFALSYDKRSQKNSTTYTESAEALLYSFNGAGVSFDYTISSGNWCGQYFVPTLPANTTYWRVTRIRCRVQKHSGDGGITRVQIRTATAGGLPTTSVIDQAAIKESDLDSNYAWRDVYLTGTATLDPAAGACVVFRWVNDDEACDVQGKAISLALSSGAKMVATGNYGSSWISYSLSSMPLSVYGVTATQNADAYSYFLTGVRVQLRSGSNSAACLNTAALVLNQPQVSGP